MLVPPAKGRRVPVWPARLAIVVTLGSAFPWHGVLGLTLISVAWPASWLNLGAVGQYTFFPLWLGYILTVDALVVRRTGTSLITRSPAAFLSLFLVSAPLWWAFEGINHLTHNWHYLGVDDVSTLRFVLVSTWHFSTVVPAVMESAELMGSIGFVRRFKRGPSIAISPRLLMGSIAVGGLSLAMLVVWPRYLFPLTWVGLFLLLDPVNYVRGQPSILARVRHGDWRLVISLGTGALLCGLFWETWNFWSMPKWEYTIEFVDFARVFEMPLLGYGGYVPFGLDVYVGYYFVRGLVSRSQRPSLLIAGSPEPV